MSKQETEEYVDGIIKECNGANRKLKMSPTNSTMTLIIVPITSPIHSITPPMLCCYPMYIMVATVATILMFKIC